MALFITNFLSHHDVFNLANFSFKASYPEPTSLEHCFAFLGPSFFGHSRSIGIVEQSFSFAPFSILSTSDFLLWR